MRIRILALALGAAGALALSTLASAKEETDDQSASEEESYADDEEDEDDEGDEEAAVYDRSAFYMIAQGTNNIGTFRGKPASNISVDPEHSMGAKGAFGYRINSHLGAELQLDWVDGFGVKLNGEGKSFNGGGITAQIKGYPLTGRLQPFGLLGLGIGAFEIRHTKDSKYKKTQAEMMLRFGGGVNYWLTEEVGLVFDASYAWPTGASGNLDDLDYVTFGWGFAVRFGAD